MTKLNSSYKNISTSIGSLKNEDIVDGIEDLNSAFLHDEQIYGLLDEFYNMVGYDDLMTEYIIADLFDRMDEIAPEGCYFGSKNGDSAEFGFWEI